MSVSLPTHILIPKPHIAEAKAGSQMVHLNLNRPPAEERHPPDLPLPSHLRAPGIALGHQYPVANSSIEEIHARAAPSSRAAQEVEHPSSHAESEIAEPKETAKGNSQEIVAPTRRWNRSRAAAG